MTESNMKEIIKRSPVNKTAARVVSHGEHFNFQKQENKREIWENPPPLIRLIPPHIKPLIGTRKGHLVVVGYLGRSSKNKKARLLVRCDCGKYEVRIASKWAKLKAINNYCQFCEQMQKLKISHLAFDERDKLENIQRQKLGLPLKNLQKANDRAD